MLALVYRASHHDDRAMKKQIIRVPDAPKSPLYRQAVKIGPTIYVSIRVVAVVTD